MGHAAGNSDMSAVYRQSVSDDRLKTVTTHVHNWLFNSDKPSRKASKEAVSQLRIVG
jgi:hypothetical protein